jgi:hypothetical protein
MAASEAPSWALRKRISIHLQSRVATDNMSELDPIVRLVSREGVKWPRYQIQLAPGLSWKQAYGTSAALLRTAERQVLIISQFKYDPKTGLVDTRVNRRDY